MASTTRPSPTPSRSSEAGSSAGDEWFFDLKTTTDLSSTLAGGKVLFATDEWFADANCMLQSTEPVFVADKYTDFGKWMDGWESRRKRTVGHDWCVMELGLGGMIRNIEVDTCFFTGNYVPRVSVQAACLEKGDPKLAALVATRGFDEHGQDHDHMGTKATAEMQAAADALGTDAWETIVPITPLGPGTPDTRITSINVSSKKRWTHLRVNMHPDGGIARFKVRGDVYRDWSAVSESDVVDLAAAANGGFAVSWSDEHYGTPANLIVSRRGINMGDGWETARNMRRPAAYEMGDDGHLKLPGQEEWAVLRLAHVGRVHRVNIDTEHFKGNFPESAKLEGLFAPSAQTDDFSEDGASDWGWRVLVPRSNLTAHSEHWFDVHDTEPVSHVKLTMYPDGGIMRLRVMGNIVRLESSDGKGDEAASDPFASLGPSTKSVTPGGTAYGHAPHSGWAHAKERAANRAAVAEAISSTSGGTAVQTSVGRDGGDPRAADPFSSLGPSYRIGSPTWDAAHGGGSGSGDGGETSGRASPPRLPGVAAGAARSGASATAARAPSPSDGRPPVPPSADSAPVRRARSGSGTILPVEHTGHASPRVRDASGQ